MLLGSKYGVNVLFFQTVTIKTLIIQRPPWCGIIRGCVLSSFVKSLYCLKWIQLKGEFFQLCPQQIGISVFTSPLSLAANRKSLCRSRRDLAPPVSCSPPSFAPNLSLPPSSHVHGPSLWPWLLLKARTYTSQSALITRMVLFADR